MAEAAKKLDTFSLSSLNYCNFLPQYKACTTQINQCQSAQFWVSFSTTPYTDIKYTERDTHSQRETEGVRVS